jgi:hydrogenase-4 component B
VLILLLLVAVLCGLALATLAGLVAPPRATAGVSAVLALAGAAAALAALILRAPAATLSLPVLLPSPGITLALDGLSGFFAAIVLLAGAACAWGWRDHPPRASATLPAALAGMLLALLAADAMALLAGLALLSLAVLVLLLAQQQDAAACHATTAFGGMAGFALLLFAAALAVLAAAPLALEGLTFVALRAHPPQGLRAGAAFGLLLLGAAAGAGVAPLHRWLPPFCTVAPAPAAALLAGAATKLPLYALARILFDLMGRDAPAWWGLVLLLVGTASAALGALRANLETDIKTVLGCAAVSQTGLIVAGFGLALLARAADLPSLASLALAAALLLAAGHALFKPLLMLAAGAVQHGAGSRDLRRLGGLAGRMPRTAAAMLLGVACLAMLPPSVAFAGQWMLLQADFAIPRAGNFLVQVAAVAATLGVALAWSLGAAAGVRLFGIAFLGRPRSPRAAAADDAGPATRTVLFCLAAAILVAGLVPAWVLALAGPALQIMTGSDMNDRAGLLGLAPQTDAPGYPPLLVVGLLAASAGFVVWLLRGRPQNLRREPAWDGGFAAAPPWLPFGDPLTQYGPAGFSQTLRRQFAEPLDAIMRRVARVFPVARLAEAFSTLCERSTRLGTSAALLLLFAVLAAMLAAVAVSEQF